MISYRLTVDAPDIPDTDAVISSRIEAAPRELNFEELSLEKSQTVASTRQRLSLPDDQRVYLSLARFIEDSPLLGEQLFALDAHRGVARVDLIDRSSNTVLRSVSYAYGNALDAAIDAQIAALQSRIAADFAPTVSN
ncbi:hypothetical protein [Paraburkholderia strydomiana]|uniref:hypothetical protein n=1 Tax=Paraburkholderia strydomiana TaxID=1245417 RepID=UPI0038BB6C6F